MGNHEFNAIAYATPDPDQPGKYLRDHNTKNAKQHNAFLTQLDPTEREYYVDWFKTLPLWLDHGHLRAVHACWHEESMRVVEDSCGGSRLTDAHMVAAAKKGTRLYRAVETLLKGPEISLTKYGQPAYLDKEGHRRTEARIRWWDSKATTLRDLADVRGTRTESKEPYPELSDREVEFEEGRTFVYTDQVPCSTGTIGAAGRTIRRIGRPIRRASTSVPSPTALSSPTGGAASRPSLGKIIFLTTGT